MFKQADFMTNIVDFDGVYFKLEYENPSGSVKDRAISVQIDHIRKTGVKRAVISSSGNAAISALYFCQKHDVELDIFVSDKINKSKLEILKNGSATIHVSSHPIKDAFKFSRLKSAYNLRQSKDELAAGAYTVISAELMIQKPETDAVFVPVSSGTIFVGIGRGFNNKNHPPSFHAVQTEAVCPIGSMFDDDFSKKETSLADSIVARYTPRENEIVNQIKSSGGSGWVISDNEIQKAQDYLIKRGLKCSYEGGTVLAALWKAKKKGEKYKYPVCLLTGKYYG